MCGIFGYSGKLNTPTPLDKVKVLGLYNVQRGVDGCGYYYNGHIHKGVDKVKNFGEYIVENPIVAGDLPINLFMGHTRKTTSGGNTYDSTHPHEVDDYIQTHNGVINNIWDLCRDYNINYKNIFVDSIGLAHIINEHGFSVLDKYEGYAALAMTRKNNPEVLYLYHGASRTYTGGELYIERPLYIMHTENGVFYSSMEESLKFIAEGDEKPISLDCNKVYKITNGLLDEEPVYVAERENANIYKPKNNKTYDYSKVYNSAVTKPVQSTFKFSSDTVPSVKEEKPPLVHFESLPKEYDTQDVYVRYGRYFRKFNILLNGAYDIDRKGNIILPGNISDFMTETYYFVNGVMMKNERAYKDFIRNYPEKIGNPGKNLAYAISKYSRYPVTTIPFEGFDQLYEKSKNLWFSDGSKFTGNIQMKLSKRQYTVKEGLLHEIKSSIEEKGAIYLSSITHLTDPFKIDNKEVNKTATYPPPIKIIPEETKNNIHAEVKNTVEETKKNVLFNEIIMLCYKPLKNLKDILDAPEAFYMFIDYIILKTLELENIKNISSSELEEQTRIYLNDLHKKGISVYDDLKSDRPLDSVYKILNHLTLKDVFTDYTHADLNELKNRYSITDFFDTEDLMNQYNEASKNVENKIIGTDSKIVNEGSTEENTIDTESPDDKSVDYENIKDIEISATEDKIAEISSFLDDLTSLADSFQTFDTNNCAQEIAFELYRAKDNLVNTLLTIGEAHPYYKKFMVELKKQSELPF